MTVYFLSHRGMSDGLIKIGVTNDLETRLNSLQHASGAEIELLATLDGGPHLERFFHHQFAADRKWGEWFARSPELEAVIARARATSAPSSPSSPRELKALTSLHSEKVRNSLRRIGRAIAPETHETRRRELLHERLAYWLPSITASRVKSLYYGEARRIEATEIDAIDSLLRTLDLQDAA